MFDFSLACGFCQAQFQLANSIGIELRLPLLSLSDQADPPTQVSEKLVYQSAWVLLGTIGYYRVLLGTLGQYWVLLRTIGYYCVLLSIIGYFWILRGSIGYFLVLLGTIGYY